ncbi:MAG: hypothetical protein QNK37_13825 [Acidobacteriota bacterium]|nr:hypothetical protein [Acidobacteriota bacterium]
MGFLSGNIACTRFNIVSRREDIDFESAAFRLIQPGSNITESVGFVSFEIDEPYEAGHGRYAFRVRIDKISVDSTMVKERWRELIKADLDAGRKVGPKAKKKLKELAEQEILSQSAPRSKVIEAVIDGDILYLGSTSKGLIGTVLSLLQGVGVEVEYKTPWLDAGLEEEPSELIDLKEPGQSLYGCRFLKGLLEDEEIFVEPEKGSVKLIAANHAKVTLAGEVLGELDRYIEEGAELLAAKLILVEIPLTFDGMAYRLNALKLDNVKADHWTEVLDERLELLKGVWEKLDEKYTAIMGTELPKPAAAAVVPNEESPADTENAPEPGSEEADVTTEDAPPF